MRALVLLLIVAVIVAVDHTSEMAVVISVGTREMLSRGDAVLYEAKRGGNTLGRVAAELA